MTLNLMLLQASHTGEDICSMVLQDVAKAALCECAVDYGIYFPGCPSCKALIYNLIHLLNSVVSATAQLSV